VTCTSNFDVYFDAQKVDRRQRGAEVSQLQRTLHCGELLYRLLQRHGLR